MASISILAIEDDARARVALLQLARQCYLDITISHSLATAFAAMKVADFDLIMLEHHILDDESIANWQRHEKEAGQDLPPVIVLTAIPLDQPDSNQFHQLLKPFKLTDFVRVIEQSTGRQLSLQDDAVAS